MITPNPVNQTLRSELAPGDRAIPDEMPEPLPGPARKWSRRAIFLAAVFDRTQKNWRGGSAGHLDGPMRAGARKIKLKVLP